MPTFLSPQYNELIEAREMDVFFKTEDMAPEMWSRLFESKPSTKAYEDGIRIAGLGTFAIKAEGTPIAFDTGVQGTRIRSVHSTYALGARFSMEIRQDEQFGVMDQMVSDLRDSGRDHKERLVWGLINDGFAGTTYTGLENEALFSSTHTLLKAGGTQSNVLTPPVALGVTGVEAIMTLAQTSLSQEGRFMDLSQSLLVVHPNEGHNADVLLETEKRPGTDMNDINTVRSSRSGLAVLKIPYLTSPTAWSIHARPGKNSLCYYNRMDTDFSSSVDADTKDQKFYAMYRGHPTFRKWENNFGSNF